MTTSDWRKTLQQLDDKKAKKRKYIKHNKPKDRAHGKTTTQCRRCGSYRGVISKYGLMVCRRCMREVAGSLGFKKYR